MRWTLFAAALVAIVPTASADDTTGVYLAESFGAVAYRGGLRRYGDGDIRLQLGLGIRRGDTSIEIFGAATGGFLEYDCYDAIDDGCAAPVGQYTTAGLDFRKRYRLLYLRNPFAAGHPTFQNPGLNLVIAGGPRWNWGDFDLHGSGPGLGASVSLEGDLWAVGYFLKAGVDVVHFDSPEGTVRGSTPYFLIGGKVGWL